MCVCLLFQLSLAVCFGFVNLCSHIVYIYKPLVSTFSKLCLMFFHGGFLSSSAYNVYERQASEDSGSQHGESDDRVSCCCRISVDHNQSC